MFSGKFIIDGKDRMNSRSGKYFRLVQPYQRHSSVPTDTFIYVYSFALNPEEHQPSGTCNMSRIEKAEMFIRLKNYINTDQLTHINGDPSLATSYSDYNMYLYAPSYNVLRFMSGMASLVFSN